MQATTVAAYEAVGLKATAIIARGFSMTSVFTALLPWRSTLRHGKKMAATLGWQIVRTEAHAELSRFYPRQPLLMRNRAKASGRPSSMWLADILDMSANRGAAAKLTREGISPRFFELNASSEMPSTHVRRTHS
jgi:hypothetical protein